MSGPNARLAVVPLALVAALSVRRGGVTMSFPLSIHFPHFERGGEVLIPMGGGSGELSSNVQGVRSTFTFTLRREQ